MTGPESLASARLRLRLLRPADAPLLFRSWTTDMDTMRYLQWRPHTELAETERLLGELIEAMRKREKWYYLVTTHVEVPVGVASLKIEDNFRASLGFIVFEPQRGHGYATEIVHTLTDWCFECPGIFRVYALCDAGNIGSIRVLQRAGFVREALLRRWAVHPNLGDEPRDALSFAKVK